jgi:hypothetical protein
VLVREREIERHPTEPEPVPRLDPRARLTPAEVRAREVPEVSEKSRRVVLLRYRVKPEHGEHNLQLVWAVFDELEVARPAGVRYSTFLLDDRLTFVSLVAIESAAGLSPLAELAEFRRVQEANHEPLRPGAGHDRAA